MGGPGRGGGGNLDGGGRGGGGGGPAGDEIYGELGEVEAGGAGEESAEGEGEEEMPFTCQFCQRQDPSFTPEGLDMHYWKDCPMLIQCEYCQQVIEIMTLENHYLEECEQREQAAGRTNTGAPNACPLCAADVSPGDDESWKRHLLQQGCPGNPRSLA